MHVCLPKALIRRRGDKNNAFCFTWQPVCNIYQMSGGGAGVGGVGEGGVSVQKEWRGGAKPLYGPAGSE